MYVCMYVCMLCLSITGLRLKFMYSLRTLRHVPLLVRFSPMSRPGHETGSGHETRCG